MFRSLKARLLTIGVLTFSLVLGIQVYVRLGFDVPELKALEAISDRKDAARVEQAAEQTLQFVRALAYEYSTWDETFDFVKNKGFGFIGQSLVAGLVSAKEIDGVRFYDKQWELLFACDRNSQTQICDERRKIRVGNELMAWLSVFDDGRQFSNSASLPGGIYQTSQGPIFFTIAPVQPSKNNTDSVGWLLFWRGLSQEQVASWREHQRVNVSASWASDEKPLPPEFLATHDFSADKGTLQRNSSGRLYWALNDVFGKPRVFLTIQYDSSFVNQNVWSRSLAVSIFLGCFIIMLMFFVLDRFLVNPLSKLASEVEQIKLIKGFLDVRLSDPGSIEIARISRQFNLLLGRVNDQYRLLQEQNQILERASYRDQLTRLPNRRALDLFVDEGWTRILSQRGSMCMALIDCDFFKQYNDNYGHDSGDQVLRRIGQILDKYNSRENTIAARYGGEEFCVVMQNTPLQEAEALLESSRVELEHMNIQHNGSDHGKVTMSIGLAQMDAAPTLHPKNLFRAADQALYTAKHSGRNCVFVSKVDTGIDSSLKFSAGDQLP